MQLPEGPHLDLLRDAIAREARGQRALLGGQRALGRDDLMEASRLYRASWEAATPTSYGRLIGMIKAAVIAGDAAEAAGYVRRAIGEPGESPAAHYALAVAALVEGDAEAARGAAQGMRAGSPAFGRAADGITALAGEDRAAYSAAITAIVEDFEGRDEHLTGVAVADTALMLECLAEPRGLAFRPASPLLPA